MKSVLMIQVILKVFGLPEKILDDLKSVRMIWKVSRWSAKYPYDLKSILKSVWMIWKVSRWSEKGPDGVQSVGMIQKMPR